MRFKKLFLIIFLSLITSNIFSQQVDLDYKFNEGKIYFYNKNLSTLATQVMGGVELKVKTDTYNLIKIKTIENEKNKNIVLHVSLDSAKVEKVKSGKTSYTDMSSYIDKRTKVTLSPDGKIISKLILDKVLKKSPYQPDLEQPMQFIQLPEKEVNFGDKWNSTLQDTVNIVIGNSIYRMDYSFELMGKDKKLGRNCYKIKFSGDINSFGQGVMLGNKVRIVGDGLTSGTVFFDNKAGIIIAIDSKTNTKLKIESTENDKINIPMTQESETSFSLKSIN